MAPPVPSSTLFISPSTTVARLMSTTTRRAATPVLAAAIWEKTTRTYNASCTPYILPSLGRLNLGANMTTTLQAVATFTPLCNTNGTASYLEGDGSVNPADLRDPFYASTIPMAYAIGATTVLSYLLLILLLISPPGSRPFFQKVATLSVVLSLTVAWADLNSLVELRYETGDTSADSIRDQILNGTKVMIFRVISDAFLYLAQIQTLIRLFPRHREKLLIKWAGIVLTVLDTVFNIANSFFSDASPAKSFLDAIPALAYLLQIALSLLYASCVLYYMFSHRQFSVMLPWSLNNQHKHAATTSKVAMPLIALLTIVIIFVPLVFFVLDISNQDLAGWGDFVRWVGASAASVMVWEMADRIEYFENLSIRAGILGRQIFEGDEMLQGIGGRLIDWHVGRMSDDDKNGGPNGGNPSSGTGAGGTLGRQLDFIDEKTGLHYNAYIGNTKTQPPNLPAPDQRLTPALSHATTGSTTYVIRVHPSSQTPPLNLAGANSNHSRSPSSTRDTTQGTSTISDFVISPANTPSNDNAVIANNRKNIHFENTIVQQSTTESPTVDASNSLAHTYRSGQAPFSPEDFTSKNKGLANNGLIAKLGFFKQWRNSDIQNKENVTQQEPSGMLSEREHQANALQNPADIVSSQTPTFDVEAVDTGQRIETPELSNAKTIEASTKKEEAAVSIPLDDDAILSTKPASFLKSLWNKKATAIPKHRPSAPLPITYIPAHARGNKAISPEAVEEARNRERERIRLGESSSEGTSDFSYNGDAIITRFDRLPEPQRLEIFRIGSPNPTTQYTGSPVSRLRNSVELDSDVNERVSLSSRSQQLGRLSTAPSGTYGSSPQIPTRTSTASPTGSVKTSSTGSWQYRASSNAGGTRLIPIVSRPVASFEDSGTSGASVPENSPPSVHQPGGKGPAPTKPSGTILNPAVIPEETENSSIASFLAPSRQYQVQDVPPSGWKGKGKAVAFDD